MHRLAVSALLLGVALPCLAARFHDQPDAGAGGGIVLQVAPIDSLETALVVEPVEYKVYEASIDRGAGRVSVRGLPPGRYDLILKFSTAVYEGLNFDVPGGYQTLPKADRDYIEWETFRSDDFFNQKNIQRYGGNRERVKLFIEQIRDKKTYEPSGRVMEGLMVRRLDLTEMRKTGKVWQIKKFRHLFREERKMDAPGRKLRFAYVPALGGVRVGDQVVALPPFDAAKVATRRYPHFYRASHREKSPSK
jgi:hypothetical protein